LLLGAPGGVTDGVIDGDGERTAGADTAVVVGGGVFVRWPSATAVRVPTTSTAAAEVATMAASFRGMVLPCRSGGGIRRRCLLATPNDQQERLDEWTL
jgi:hypothetical protein